MFRSADEDEDNILQLESQRIVGWVDLDNEEFVKEKTSEESKEVCNEEVSDSLHPLYACPTPVAPCHCWFPLFVEEGLPQVLSPELLTLALTVFRISNNPSLRLGFDSLGAGAELNHLHLHFFFANAVLRGNSLPIEGCRKQLVLESSLRHRKQDEINMFSIGVNVYEALDYPAHCLLITPSVEIDDENVSEAIESVSNVAGILLNHLVELNIPHNLLMSSSGSIYVFPRAFLSEDSAGFFEMAGLIRSETAEQSEESVAEMLREASVSEGEFEEMKQFLVKMLRSIYF